MLCPHCGRSYMSDPYLSPTTVEAHKTAARTLGIKRLTSAAATLGRKGGATKGKTKAREVDYRELARLSHQRRRENKARKG